MGGVFRRQHTTFSTVNLPFTHTSGAALNTDASSPRHFLRTRMALQSVRTAPRALLGSGRPWHALRQRTLLALRVCPGPSNHSQARTRACSAQNARWMSSLRPGLARAWLTVSARTARLVSPSSLKPHCAGVPRTGDVRAVACASQTSSRARRARNRPTVGARTATTAVRESTKRVLARPCKTRSAPTAPPAPRGRTKPTHVVVQKIVSVVTATPAHVVRMRHHRARRAPIANAACARPVPSGSTYRGDARARTTRSAQPSPPHRATRTVGASTTIWTPS